MARKYNKTKFEESVYGVIYLGTCSKSVKPYVGLTTRGMKQRLGEHEINAKNLKNDYHFYNAIRKFGFENFSFEIIHYINFGKTDDENKYRLNELEKTWIAQYDSFDNGYNSTIGGLSGGRLSAETKDRISEAQRGEKNHNFGKPMSAEQKKKISKSHLGIPAWNKGKSMTQEQKLKKSIEMKKFYAKRKANKLNQENN